MAPPTPRARPGADDSDRLADGLSVLGFGRDAALLERLLRFRDELARWNQAYNLTAIRDPVEMVVRHLLDAAAALAAVRARAPEGERQVLDVGSGGGIPGLVWALMAPEWRYTLVDSNGKKARFLRHAVRTLALAHVEVCEARVEALLPGRHFDLVTSRAFAALGDFVALTAPLIAPGGQWVALKGKLDPRELAGLPAGCQLTETQRLRVPGLAEDRHLVWLRPA